MNIPIDVDTPEMELAEKIAKILATYGFDDGLACPFAINLICSIARNIDNPAQVSKEIDYWLKRKSHENPS